MFADPAFRVEALKLTLGSLERLVETYKSLETFPEQFARIHSALAHATRNAKKHKEMRDLLQPVKEMVESHMKACLGSRRSLILKAQKPKQIKQLNPDVAENFQPGRDMDPDRERVERKKLQKKVKRERKHAMRALQRDSVFIARERQRKMLQQQNEAARKKKRIRSEMEREYADTNVHAFKSRKKDKK